MSAGTAAMSPSPAPEGSGFRLSPQQQRLCELHEVDGPAVYRFGAVMKVPAGANADRLQEACATAVRAHEILRSVYRATGEPAIRLQFIQPADSVAVLLERFDDRDYESALEHFFGEKLDWERGPVCRFALLRHPSGEWRLAILVAAAACDRASLAEVASYIARSYEALSNGAPADAVELQYADVAEWLAELPESENAGPGRRFWHDQYLRAEKPSRLYGERERAAGAAFEPRRLGFEWPAAVVEQLRSLAGLDEAQAWMSACWRVLLCSLAGSNRLPVAVWFPGRDMDELAHAVGAFGRYLPVTIDPESHRTFADLVAEERRLLGESARWQHFATDAPEAPNLRAGESLRYWPYGFEAAERSVAAGLEDLCGCGERFHLLLSVECGDGGSSALYYDDAVFANATAGEIVSMLQTLAASASRSPNMPPMALPFLPESTLRVLADYGVGPALPPETATIPQRIASHAARTPEAIAVRSGASRVSYGELWRRSGQLAGFLRERGAGQETLVALAMHRSLDAVVAMVGILRSGAAYVPVDAAYPPDRQRLVLEDCGASMVLTHDNLLANATLPGVNIHQFAECFGAENASAELVPDPASLAYVIYTSGSTGRPKGVQVTHANLRDSTCARFAVYAAAPEKYLLLSSFAFDSSVAGIFWTLATGGELTLPSPGTEKDVQALSGLITSGRVTHLLAVPSLYRALLEQSEPAALDSLRVAIVAGEECPAGLVTAHGQRLPNCALYNEYGPTEATVWCTSHLCGAIDGAASVPIGRPVPGASTYVLDAHMRPALPGVAGEIYIGGRGVSRGYVGQAGITAARFVPDPFSESGGERLYTTGDRGRWRSDGSLEFLGRIDDQVKLRGFRIELGEVEAALHSHPGVQEAAAVVRKGRTEEPRLVGYAVAKSGYEIASSDLRRHVAAGLPEWMVPSAIVLLDAMPRSPNGKVDRNALPSPDEDAGRSAEGRQPSTPTEAALAKIWCDVLKLDRVGVDETFISVGGDSLLGLQVIARARQAHIRISARLLFEYPTIAGLAAHAEVLDAGSEPADQTVRPASGRLSPVQRWFFERNLARPDHYNQALLLSVRERLDLDLLEQAVQAVCARHDSLRLRFRQTADGWQQRVAALETSNVVSFFDIGSLPESQREPAFEGALNVLNAGFDLRRGPLFKVALFRRAAGEPDWLYWAAHHLAVDAVSWRILVDDLEAAYRALSEGREPQLPAPSTSAPAWADHLSEAAATADVEQDRDFWRDRLSRPYAKLPLDFPGGTNREADTEVSTETLDEALTAALLKRGGVHETLVSALGLTLTRWCSADTVRIDCERHGRASRHVGLDASRSTGWFTSIYPVISEFAPGQDLAEGIAAAMTNLRALPDDGFTYGLLRYQPAAPLQDDAPGEVLFNYLGEVGMPGDAFFQLASTSRGQTRHPENQRSHLIEIDAELDGPCLRFEWRFSRACHTRATIERQARALSDLLKILCGS